MFDVRTVIGEIALVALFVMLGWSIVETKGWKWRVLNLLIVLGYFVVGAGMGVVVGLYTHSPAFGGAWGATLSPVVACFGAYDCIRRNRNKKRKIVA